AAAVEIGVTVKGSRVLFASPLFSAFFDDGASVTYSYAATVASTVAGKQYVLTTPAPTPASPITVNASITVTGTYKAQYQVTFAQAGITDAAPAATIVTVNGSPKVFATPLFSAFFDDGASVTRSEERRVGREARARW